MALIRTAGKIISEINKSQLQLASSRCLSVDRNSSFAQLHFRPEWNVKPERSYSTKSRPRSKSWISGYLAQEDEPKNEPHKVGPKTDSPSWFNYIISKVTGSEGSRQPSPAPPPVRCVDQEKLDKESAAAAKEAMRVAGKCLTNPNQTVMAERQPRPPPQPRPPNSTQQVTKDPQYRMPCAPCTPSSAKCTGVLDFSNKIPYSEMRPATPSKKPACQPRELPGVIKIGCTLKSRLSSEILCHSRKSRKINNMDEPKKSMHTDFKLMSSANYADQKFETEKPRMVPEIYYNMMGAPRCERERSGRSSSPTRLLSGVPQRSFSNRSQSLPIIDRKNESKTQSAGKGESMIARRELGTKEAPDNDTRSAFNLYGTGAAIKNYFKSSQQREAETTLASRVVTKAAQSRQNMIQVYNDLSKERLSVQKAIQKAYVNENNKQRKEIDIAPKPYKADVISSNAVDENTVKLKNLAKNKIDRIRRSTDRDQETKLLQIQSLKASSLGTRPKSAPVLGKSTREKTGLAQLLGFQSDNMSDKKMRNIFKRAAPVAAPEVKAEKSSKVSSQTGNNTDKKKQKVARVQKKVEPIPDKLPFKIVNYNSTVPAKKATSLQTLTEKRPVSQLKDMINRQFSQLNMTNVVSAKEAPKAAPLERQLPKPTAAVTGNASVKRDKKPMTASVAEIAPLKPINNISKTHFTRLTTIFSGERNVGPLKAIENPVTLKTPSKQISPPTSIATPKAKSEVSRAKDSDLVQFKTMKITPIEYKRATTFLPKIHAKIAETTREHAVVKPVHEDNQATWAAERKRNVESNDPAITDAQKKMIVEIGKRLQSIHLNHINTHVDAHEGKIVLVDGKHLVQHGRNLSRYYSSRAEDSPLTTSEGDIEPLPPTRTRSSETAPRVSGLSMRKSSSVPLKRSYSDSAFRRLELGAGSKTPRGLSSKEKRNFSKIPEDDQKPMNRHVDSNVNKKIPPIPSFSDYLASRKNQSNAVAFAAARKATSTGSIKTTPTVAKMINPDPLPQTKELGAWYFNVKRKDKSNSIIRHPVLESKTVAPDSENEALKWSGPPPARVPEIKTIAWPLDPNFAKTFVNSERAASRTEKLMDAANAVRKHAQFANKKPRGYANPIAAQPTKAMELTVTRAEFLSQSNVQTKFQDRPRKTTVMAPVKPADPELFKPLEVTPSRTKEKPVFREDLDEKIFDLPKKIIERKKCGPSLLIVNKNIERDGMQCLWNPFAKKEAPKKDTGKGKEAPKNEGPCKKKDSPDKNKNIKDPKKDGPCSKGDPCKKKDDPKKKKDDPCKKKDDKNKEDPCKKKEDPCKKKEDPCKKKEDPCKKKEDPCKKKEDPCKKKDDPCKKKEDTPKKKENACKVREDPCKKKEDPCKKKEDPCKKKEDPCKKKEDPCKKKEDPCKKKEDPCKKKEDPCKPKEDPCKKKEDPCKKKEDPCKKKEDPCKKKEDPCKKKEDPCKKKEDPCKKKEDPCKKKEDPCKKKDDPCKKKEDPCKKKEDPCKPKEDPCKKKEDPCKKKEDPCKKKEDPCKKKEDPCKPKEDPFKKKEDPCKKKEDPCKKKEDPCKPKEDPCKKKEDPCKKKEDPCKKKEDPCKPKEDPCKKKEDPCKKKEDPCKKKEDPCKPKEDPFKKKEDPCKKKEDPCKKKEDPCKPKEDPCKKKEDPCKKKEDPCKKKEDPCKKKEDPCKKKEDPCKKKEDPCKPKEDPCKKKEDPCKKKDSNQDGPQYPLRDDPCSGNNACRIKDKKDDPCKKDDSKKDPCKKDDAKKDPCKKDDAKKDPCKKDDAKKDPCKKDDAKKDPCKKDDAKKDPCSDKDDKNKSPCKRGDPCKNGGSQKGEGKKDPCKKDGGKKEDTKKDPCKKDGGKKEDTKKDPCKKDGSKKGDSKRDGSKKGDTKRDGSKKGDSKKDGSKKDDSKKDPCKKDGSKKGDSKRDGSKKGDTKRDGSKKGDTKRDGSKKGDSKKDGNKKDDGKKDPCKKDGSKKGDTKKDSGKKDGSKKGDTKKDPCKKDGSKKGDTKKDSGKKDPCKKDDNKKGDGKNDSKDKSPCKRGDPCKKDDSKKDSPCKKKDSESSKKDGSKDTDKSKEGEDSCTIEKAPRKGPSCIEPSGEGSASGEGGAGGEGGDGECTIAKVPRKGPSCNGDKKAAESDGPTIVMNVASAPTIPTVYKASFTETLGDCLHKIPKNVFPPSMGVFQNPYDPFGIEVPHVFLPPATTELPKSFNPCEDNERLLDPTGNKSQFKPDSKNNRPKDPEILLPAASSEFPQTTSESPSNDLEYILSSSTSDPQLPPTSQDKRKDPVVLLPAATHELPQSTNDRPPNSLERVHASSNSDAQFTPSSQDQRQKDPVKLLPAANRELPHTNNNCLSNESPHTGVYQFTQPYEDIRPNEAGPSTSRYPAGHSRDQENSNPTNTPQFPQTFHNYRCEEPEVFLSSANRGFLQAIPDFPPDEQDILRSPRKTEFPQSFQECQPEDELDVIVIKSPKRRSGETTTRSFLGLNDLGTFCTPEKDPFYNPPGPHYNMDVENIELAPKRPEAVGSAAKLELSSLVASSQPTFGRRSDSSSQTLETMKSPSRPAAMLNQNQTRDFSFKADLTSEEMRIIYQQNAIVKASMDTSLQNHLNNVLSTLTRLVVGGNTQAAVENNENQNEEPVANMAIENDVDANVQDDAPAPVQVADQLDDNVRQDEQPAPVAGERSPENEDCSAPAIFAMPRLPDNP